MYAPLISAVQKLCARQLARAPDGKKNLSGGKHAVALFNRGESALSFESAQQILSQFKALRLRDVWTQAEVRLDSKKITVPSHAVLLLKEY